MRFERYSEPILPFHRWVLRVARSIWLAVIFAAIMLLVGVVGYHALAHLPWVDSFLEASMILAGMGPVSPLTTDAAKIFASVYALMSGLVIIGATGLILAPWLHRMLHHLHQPPDTDEPESSKKRTS
jgi:hypothetical protein